MSALIQAKDFSQLFINDTALLDTRAPIEFLQGAFPQAENLPLMSDAERQQIGICYKKQGQQSAVALGHQLVSGDIKQCRLAAWLAFIRRHPDGALYCLRGGLRSQITQTWIFQASGIDYPRIEGGYKALRRFLMDETTRIMNVITPIVLGGQTGCGKTLLLKQIQQQIDLEALANHRGSAFGNTTIQQPTQIAFENRLAAALMKKQRYSHLIFEDESINIGAVHIPGDVRAKTVQADLVLLEANLETRLSISMDAYVINMHQDFISQDSEKGFKHFCDYWLSSLEKIRKRLGLMRYQKLRIMLIKALHQVQLATRYDGFYPIIETLLTDYYDPMYNHQIASKQHRIVFRGEASQVLDYIVWRCGSSDNNDQAV